MTDLAHGIWAAATASVAFCGYRVSVVWLGQHERKNIRDEHRDERDNGAVTKLDEMETRLKAMGTRIDTFIANNGRR